MSENAHPNDGLFDADESTIQRRWDQYAMPDLVVDSGSLPTHVAPIPLSSTDKIGSPHSRRVRRFLNRGGQGQEG